MHTKYKKKRNGTCYSYAPWSVFLTLVTHTPHGPFSLDFCLLLSALNRKACVTPSKGKWGWRGAGLSFFGKKTFDNFSLLLGIATAAFGFAIRCQFKVSPLLPFHLVLFYCFFFLFLIFFPLAFLCRNKSFAWQSWSNCERLPCCCIRHNRFAFGFFILITFAAAATAK